MKVAQNKMLETLNSTLLNQQNINKIMSENSSITVRYIILF